MSVRKISILHLASDEKFINAANMIFEEAFPESNLFVIPQSRFNKQLRYVKPVRNIQTVGLSHRLLNELTNRAKNYDCIFLHGITPFNSSFALKSDQWKKITGILWGAELYSDENFPDGNLLGRLTAAIPEQKMKPGIKDWFKAIGRKVLYPGTHEDNTAVGLASPKLNFLAIPYEEELKFFQARNILSPGCKMIPFTYFPLEYIVQGNEELTISGNDILLGNSAYKTNNHLEAFQILKEINTGNRRIVTPLSYGNAYYGDLIATKGREVFGNQFYGVREFMPINKYNELLQTCGIAIMNHYRQQAVGNIFSLVWMGSKVYLNEQNTVFQYLKRIGIQVFSIEKDLKKPEPSVLENLPITDIQSNREILKKEISLNKLIQDLRLAIDENFLSKK